MNTLLFGTEEERGTVRSALLKMDDVDLVMETADESSLLSLVDASRADVVMICLDGSAKTYRVAEQVYQLRPRCLVMGVAVNGMESLDVLEALRSGICHIVDINAGAEAATEAFQNVCRVECSRHTAFTDVSFSTVDSKIITVFGVKDGLGASSLAVNLGLLLARAGKKTIVLDFDLQFGDCALQLGLNARRTLTDLVQEGDDPSIDRIRQNILLHPTGLNVLAAPNNPEYAEQVSAVQLEGVISTLRGFYDYIIIDASSQFNEITAMCCEKSKYFLFLTRADISVLRHTKKVLLLIDMLGQMDKVRCVLTQVKKNMRISQKEAAGALGVSFWLTLPFDDAAMENAINQGSPICQLAPRCDLAQAMATMAGVITAESETLEQQTLVVEPGAKGASKRKQASARKKEQRQMAQQQKMQLQQQKELEKQQRKLQKQQSKAKK